jgi:hypothetical protein
VDPHLCFAPDVQRSGQTLGPGAGLSMTWRFTGPWPPQTDKLDIDCRYDSEEIAGGACDLELLGSSR